MSQIQNPKERIQIKLNQSWTSNKEVTNSTQLLDLLTFDPLSLKMISTSRILPNCWEIEKKTIYWLKSCTYVMLLPLNSYTVMHYIWDKHICSYPKHLPQVWVPKPKRDIGNMEPFGLGLPSSFLLTSTSCSTSRCHSKRLWVRCYRCQRIILWGWQEWKIGRGENVGAERGNRRRKSEEEVKEKNRKNISMHFMTTNL